MGCISLTQQALHVAQGSLQSLWGDALIRQVNPGFHYFLVNCPVVSICKPYLPHSRITSFRKGKRIRGLSLQCLQNTAILSPADGFINILVPNQVQNLAYSSQIGFCRV